MSEAEEKKLEATVNEEIANAERLLSRPVGDLRMVLDELQVNHTGVLEKSEMVSLAREKLSALSTESVKSLMKMLKRIDAEYAESIATKRAQGELVEKSTIVNHLLCGLWKKLGFMFNDGFVRRYRPDAGVESKTPVLDWVAARDFSLEQPHKMVTPGEVVSVSKWKFRQKMAWFNKQVEKMRIKWEHGHVKVKVRRSRLLEDSFNVFRKLSPNDMHRIFRFEFVGEAGIDAGGLAREWFHIVSDTIFNVDFGLFEYSGVDNLCYQINPSSGIANELHLHYFQFAGRMLGKALFDRQLCSAHMAMPLYKHIIAWPISMKDMDFVDAELAKNLRSLLEMEDVQYLYLDFTTGVREFGETKTIELKPGGADIELTNDNRVEYLNLMLKHVMFDRAHTQLGHFLKGFYEVIPIELLQVFDYRELELLLCGLPQIDVADWRSNTLYRGKYKPKGLNHKVIKWFWEVVDEIDESERARLLQFATGTSRVPVQGFCALQSNDGNIKKFTIESIEFKDSVYPKAHTCFNRIELPLYKSKQDLKTYVLQAINLEICGFGAE